MRIKMILLLGFVFLWPQGVLAQEMPAQEIQAQEMPAQEAGLQNLFTRTPMKTRWRIEASQLTLQLPLLKGCQPTDKLPFASSSAPSPSPSSFPAAQKNCYYYDFVADWGDGQRTRIQSPYHLQQAQHTYARPGVYEVRLYGELPAWGGAHADYTRWRHSDSNLQLLDVLDLGHMGWKSLAYAFAFCKNLKTFSVSRGQYVAQVTDMSFMFDSALQVRPNVKNFNTSSLNNIQWMFRLAFKARPQVQLWDTSRITNMQGVFTGAFEARPDVSKWDVSQVTDTSFMFARTQRANPDVSQWQTHNLQNAQYMFAGAHKAAPDVSNWITPQLRNIKNMFYQAEKSNPQLEAWNLSQLAPQDLEGLLAYSGVEQANYEAFVENKSLTHLPPPVDKCDFETYTPWQRISFAHTDKVQVRWHHKFPAPFYDDVYTAVRIWNQALGRKLLVVEESPFRLDLISLLFPPAAPLNTWHSTAAHSNQLEELQNVILLFAADSDLQLLGLNNFLAHTRPMHYKNQLKRAFVYFNFKQFLFLKNDQFSTRRPKHKTANFLTVFLHELGHSLGLQHNTVDKSSILYQTKKGVFDAKKPPRLSPYDKNNIACEY